MLKELHEQLFIVLPLANDTSTTILTGMMVMQPVIINKTAVGRIIVAG